jgi:hypothetical protein
LGSGTRYARQYGWTINRGVWVWDRPGFGKTIGEARAAAGEVAPPPGFAGGTTSTPLGTILVGEKGPELAQADPHHPIAEMIAGFFGQPMGDQYRGLSGAPDPTDPDDPRRPPKWRAPPRFASGTTATPPGTILVGEEGPELITQPGGLQVVPATQTKAVLAQHRGPAIPGFAAGTIVEPVSTIQYGTPPQYLAQTTMTGARHLVGLAVRA